MAVSSLGASSKPARAYNAMLFAFAFSQALEMHFLPLLSMSGIYTTFIVCFLLTIPFISWIPAHAPNEVAEVVAADSLAAQSVPKFVPWLCLAAMVITYINIGAYWTYIELAAASDQADPEWVGQVLTWSSFCSLIGCLFATILSSRYGLLRPLLVTLVTMAVIVGMLANGITDKNILISVLSFNFLWIFIDVYQMSTIANVDKTGQVCRLNAWGSRSWPDHWAKFSGLDFGFEFGLLWCVYYVRRRGHYGNAAVCLYVPSLSTNNSCIRLRNLELFTGR